MHQRGGLQRLPCFLLGEPGRGEQLWLQLIGPHTCYYRNEELIAP